MDLKYLGQSADVLEEDHTMPTSNNAYFSIQIAFYNRLLLPGGNFLSNNL